MKELKIFLQALEELKEDSMFIDKLTITPQRPMTAYKKYVLEVWAMTGGTKQQVFRVECINKSTNESQDNTIKEALIKDMIKQILKYYGT